MGGRTVRNRTREHVWLWWKLDVTGGQSGTVGRTVRRSNSNCTREGVFSGWAFDLCGGPSAGYLTICTRDIVVSGGFQGLTVDGPPLGRGRSAGLFQICTRDDVRPGGEEYITADGLPLGRGRSARAVTDSSDTH